MSEVDKFAAARHRMVVEQLQAQGIMDAEVLAAMESVPRERFVPEDLAEKAYSNCALPIACDQTISQPLIVAMMTEALALTGTEHVLEIGTGSGYQTAVLSHLTGAGGDVVSIERHAELSRVAKDRLHACGCQNVRLVVGDGSLGWTDLAPYDRIIVTAAAPRCPPALWDQLKAGGLIVIPVGSTASQTLQQIRKRPDGTSRIVSVTGCRFVPLIGAGT